MFADRADWRSCQYGELVMDPTIKTIQHLWYPPEAHPYVIFENTVRSYLHSAIVILDAGCGRAAPVLHRLAPLAGRAIGIDLIVEKQITHGIEILSADLHALPLPDSSIDLIYSRSVLEHIEKPAHVFLEFARVLRTGGHLVCLTPNKWDYASLIAMAVPNTWHPAIVAATEGRARSEVFPTYYRANTRRKLRQLSEYSGLRIIRFEHLGQYPNYLAFSPVLFRLGCYYDRLLATISALHWLRGWILADFAKRE